ncbi:hypothetical protein [Kribbella steppae]|uniref:hypothetical protein n=1 Tax=Kribbella steppae TaxID=2512223 RepID=UPI00104E1935|nr:hypothetical protein [Kribbella steppae]
MVLFDDDRARNRTASHVHNYLGVDDPSPAELLAVGRRQATTYGVEVTNARVGDTTVDNGSVDGGLVDDGFVAVGTTAVPSLFAIGAAGHASTTAVALHADLLERDVSS